MDVYIILFTICQIYLDWEVLPGDKIGWSATGPMKLVYSIEEDIPEPYMYRTRNVINSWPDIMCGI